MDPAITATNGARLAALTTPLFPPIKEFAGLNNRLLLDNGEVAAGGKVGKPSPLYRLPATVEAGGTLPVVQDQTGTFCIDTTPIEAAFDELFSTVRQLAEEIQQGKEKELAEKCKPHIQTMRNTLSSTRATIRTATGVRNTHRGGYRGGRGGRGGGRGGDWRSNGRAGGIPN